MSKNIYKKIALCFCAVLLSFGTQLFAQTDNHFIYIQAKNKQPFYVILNKKVYSSSTIGYLIIPKLKNGSYTLKIGFPKQSDPEKEFNCVVNDADVGYSLQANDNGQFGLLDLQSQTFIASAGSSDGDDAITASSTDNAPASNTSQTVITETPVKKASSSAFGDMLSAVANDSTLNQKAETEKSNEPIADQVQQAVVQNGSTDSFGKNPQADIKEVIATNNEKNLKPANVDDDQTYGVIKSSENTSNSGQQMTFVLFNSRTTDTVNITIPPVTSAQQATDDTALAGNSLTQNASSPKYGDRSLALFKNSDGDTVPADNSYDSNSEISSSERKKKKSPKLLNASDATIMDSGSSNAINNPFYKKSADTLEQNTEGNNSVTSENPPCDNPFSNSDLQRTEKKMLRKGNDDDMLALADKAIKGKCITTEQAKQLGRLFLSDAGRFAFYQDAYPAVSDKDNYASLQDQLLDAYFKKRFTGMLQNQ